MSTMRLQTFAGLHDLTITGQAEVHKDHFARYYIDGVRVAFTNVEGTFTVLTCVDGSKRYVMTTDWAEVERTAGTSVSG